MLHLFCCCYFECNNEHPEDEIDMRDPTHFAVDVCACCNKYQNCSSLLYVPYYTS